ncbi:hypothetical protein MKX01_031271 [Papaver californicum]|nr:hypothetical protein MKX01_031271 [Papaver californicum]
MQVVVLLLGWCCWNLQWLQWSWRWLAFVEQWFTGNVLSSSALKVLWSLGNLIASDSHKTYVLTVGHDITGGSLGFIQHSIRECIPGFVNLVRSADIEAARICLQFLELVMRGMPDGEGPKLVELEDGIDAKERFQFHENEDLRILANGLLKHHLYVVVRRELWEILLLSYFWESSSAAFSHSLPPLSRTPKSSWTVFAKVFYQMYGLPPEVEALPPMPENGGCWSALHNWLRPTRSFVEFVMFSRMYKGCKNSPS